MTPKPILSPCICGDTECAIPYGTCHCGCNGNTAIATHTSIDMKMTKGKPKRYIHGHHRTIIRLDTKGMSQFKIDGIYCRLIALTQGQFTIVNAEDYEYLSKWKWFAVWDEHSRCYYAGRQIKERKGKSYIIYMHRQILGLQKGDVTEGDHKETLNTLDNRRANLRLANRKNQMRNRRRFVRNSTGYKGVDPVANSKSFRARIMIDGIRVHLGVRSTAESAHRELYVPAAKKYYGEFARFN